MHGLANPKNGILNLLCILEILLCVKGSKKMDPAVLLILVLFHQPFAVRPLLCKDKLHENQHSEHYFQT
jgi:hypothetical protein